MVIRRKGGKASAREVVSVLIGPYPKTYNQAKKSVKEVEWKEAAEAEPALLEETQTWAMVPEPKISKPYIPSGYSREKTDANGNLKRFKARMVACVSVQVLEANYDLTFAAVMDLETAKIILALARIWGMPARHGDVPNAYEKAPTEKNLDLNLHVPQGMAISVSKIWMHSVLQVMMKWYCDYKRVYLG